MPSSAAHQASATATTLLVPARHLGTIAISGPDRRTWLNGLVTSDLAKLGPGEASYGLALVKVGRIVSDAWVLPAEERLLVAAPRERIELLEQHLEKYLIMEDASHADVSGEYAWAFAYGPRAAAVADEVAAVAGTGVFAGVLELTRGQRDAVIAAPTAKMGLLLADIAGRHSDVALGSEEEAEALRVRRFLPRFGVDFGEKNYPQEAALEKIAVSFNKGCYLGQEVVCRLEMRGHVIKKIVPIRFAASDPPAAGAEVRSSEGKVLGTMSSAVANEGGALGLAMVRLDFSEPGTKLEVAGREATVLGA